MIRGTTPTHTFTSPIDVSMIEAIRVIYSQNGNVKFVKTKIDCESEGKTISIKLTQQETLCLTAGQPVKIQVRMLTTGDDALASRPIYSPVEDLEEDVPIEKEEDAT